MSHDQTLTSKKSPGGLNSNIGVLAAVLVGIASVAYWINGVSQARLTVPVLLNTPVTHSDGDNYTLFSNAAELVILPLSGVSRLASDHTGEGIFGLLFALAVLFWYPRSSPVGSSSNGKRMYLGPLILVFAGLAPILVVYQLDIYAVQLYGLNSIDYLVGFRRNLIWMLSVSGLGFYLLWRRRGVSRISQWQDE